jgi:hypothetical protein
VRREEVGKKRGKYGEKGKSRNGENGVRREKVGMRMGEVGMRRWK